MNLLSRDDDEFETLVMVFVHSCSVPAQRSGRSLSDLARLHEKRN
jgi:hypothetical protein